MIILAGLILLTWLINDTRKMLREDHETLYALIDCDTTMIKEQVNLDITIGTKMKDLYYSDSVKYSQIVKLQNQYRYLYNKSNKK